MSANPEQRVIDDIDALVDWQIEEGRKRGDGPTAGVSNGVSFRSYSHGGTTFVAVDPADPFSGYYQFPHYHFPAEILDEAYQWTDAELREARLQSCRDLAAAIDDPVLTLPPFRRAWLNDPIRSRPADPDLSV